MTLLRDRAIHVRSISDGIDPATSTGRLMLNMLATLAEYERELIIERVNAGITAARQNGTRFGRPLSDPAVIADKLAIAQDARAKGRTAEDAARLVGWSRATLYRHQQDLAARKSTTMLGAPERRTKEASLPGFVNGGYPSNCRASAQAAAVILVARGRVRTRGRVRDCASRVPGLPAEVLVL